MSALVTLALTISLSQTAGGHAAHGSPQVDAVAGAHAWCGPTDQTQQIADQQAKLLALVGKAPPDEPAPAPTSPEHDCQTCLVSMAKALGHQAHPETIADQPRSQVWRPAAAEQVGQPAGPPLGGRAPPV